MSEPVRERRLLYVISRYTYRSTFIVREIEELAARGWAITVVSLRRPEFAPGTTVADLPYAVAHDWPWSPGAIMAATAAMVTRAPAIAATCV